jgi:predicted MFS family arabinose efflux permease
MATSSANSAALAPYWPRTLVLFTAVNFLNDFDRSVFSEVLEPIRQDLKLVDGMAGLMVGAFALLYAIVGVQLRWIADRYRRVTMCRSRLPSGA